MGKNREQFNRRTNFFDEDSDSIREHQHLRPRTKQRFSSSQYQGNRPLRWTVVVLLERGESFEGKALAFSNPKMPKCKVFFKDRGKDKELGIASDVDINAGKPERETALQSAINDYLIQLHLEAGMEFPEWLEKYSTRIDETNPFFNLDEIREEFRFKKSRFGIWRKAAALGFFTDMKPTFADFNRIVRLELKEYQDFPK